MAGSTASSDRSRARSHTERTISAVSDESTPLLGNEAEIFNACNRKLGQLGIDDTIKLPRLVVVGDQSTGKSSLIEAISTIKVPKAKGCCTQCPLAINLSSGAEATSPWTCTVSIEEHYEFVESLISKGVTKNNPFGPWQKKDQMKLVAVKTTNNKDEVPKLIRAAQSAVVNPGTSPQEYLEPVSCKPLSNKSTQFSPNVIRVDISEGRWASLSFVDLPGVIANTGKEKDKFLVKLIRNLVQQYASAERSVNMLALPMTHDVENSQACAIIQTLKAEEHTLAVFTKADLADDDQRTQILRQSTEGDDLGFKHGYHFVVMPDNMELNEARSVEADVFAEKPWSTLSEEVRSRLGVGALTSYLRRLLFEKTRETLPDNLNSIRTRLSEVDAELSTLPPPPNAVLLPMKLQQCMTKFESAMKSLFAGGQQGQATDQGLSARTGWTQNAMEFRDRVTNAKPTVFLMSRTEQNRLNKANAHIRSLQSKQVTNKTNAIEIDSGDEQQPSQPPQPPVKAESTTSKTKLDPVHRFQLEDIRSMNERHYQTGVRGDIELRAIEDMNKLSVQHWDALLSEFMNANSALLNKQVNEVLEMTFGSYRHLSLFTIVQEHVKNFLDTEIHQEWARAEDACRLEQEIPLTYDITTLLEKKTKCLKERMPKREDKRLELQRVEAEATGAKSKRRKEDNDLGPDPFENELVMSAKNRAYYEIASTRFVDNILLGIFGRLLPNCSLNLAKDLEDRLGLNDPDKHGQIIEWMTEDSERENRRRCLLQEKQQLEEGFQYIREVLSVRKDISTSSPKRCSSGDHCEDRAPKTPSKRHKTEHSKPGELTLSSTPSRLVGGVEIMEIDS